MEETKSTPSCSKGRPQKHFDESSIKTKKRRVAGLLASGTPEELRFAADLNKEKPVSTSPKSTLSSHQALALYLDLDLSERKYNTLKSVVNAVHPNCFPSLYQLNKTKTNLIPISITATETQAEVNLKDLLQITIKSLLDVANLNESSTKLKLTLKWGFDGSSGHSTYKQRFTEESSTDEYMFLEAMVPLLLTDIESGKDLWVNLRPSSTLFCRPIKFIFAKENDTLVLNEAEKMKESIQKLENFVVPTANGKVFDVSCEMLFTMMDGSVVNTLSHTNSTATCIICGATPKEMNTVEVLKRAPIEEHYRYGMSTLHCWIRFFECLLHIGYRLPVKVWQVRNPEHKVIVKENKKKIQAQFKSKMGLIVDKPKPGYGSTNDGNTARRFFMNPDLSSEITGVDKNLIEKFSIILKVLASGNPIDIDKFRVLLEDTRNMYIQLYGWYYMPNSVHKVLVHGCDIIDSFSLPIGQLSEDALEARHKDLRKNRLAHTRKCSRESSNKDLMKILLLTSDPFISSLRKIVSKKSVECEEVSKYLKQTLELNPQNDLFLDLPNLTISSEDSSESE